MQDLHDVSQCDPGTSRATHRLLLWAAWLALVLFAVTYVWHLRYYRFMALGELCLYFGFFSIVWGLCFYGFHNVVPESSETAANGLQSPWSVEKIALPALLSGHAIWDRGREYQGDGAWRDRSWGGI